MKKIIQINRFMVMIVAMLTLCVTSAWGGTTWTLVNATSDLKAGDVYVLACNSKGMTATNISNQVMGNVASTFSTDKKTITSLGSNTIELTLGGSEGEWTLSNSSNKALGATAAKKLAWGSGTTTWTISISSGEATITNTTTSYGVMKYNSSSPRFTTYASGQTVVQLYKKVVTTDSQIALSPKSIDFGDVYQNASVSAQTIAATLSNITGNATVAFKLGTFFSVSPTSLTQDGDVTITPNNTTIGEFKDTLIVSATGAADTAIVMMNVVEAPAAYDVVHDFSQISGLASWGSSYTQHIVNYTNDDVVFAAANKSTSTITDVPVTRGQPISAVLTNNTKYISKVKFECTKWGSKAQTITLNYSKDGGQTYTATSTKSTNFTLESELLDSVNAVKFTFSSSSNQVGIAKLSFNMSERQLVSSAVNVIAPESTKGTLVVKKGETVISSGSNATELDELTIVATPQAGYKVKSVSVIDASQNEVAVDENNKFVMPNMAVTVSAEFESAKVLSSVEITTPATTTEFWKGNTFSAAGLVLTAHYDGANDSIVTPDSIVGYDMSVAGVQTVKVYFSEGVTTKYATYNIIVKTIANTKETAYSVDSAKKIVNAGKDLATSVYVKGVISGIGTLNEGGYFDGLYIKDAGQSNSFQCYKMYKDAQSTAFVEGDLKLNDTIIAFGPIKKYGTSTYEFNGCYMVERKAYVETPCDIHNTPATAYTASQAKAIIDQGECLDTRVYVKGVVSKVTSLTDGKLNIYVKDENGQEFEYYKCWNIDSVAFEATTDIQTYDTLIALGTMTKFISTYEFNDNCVLISRKAFVPHVLSVSLDKTEATIKANGSVQLTATVLPEDAPDKSVTWSVTAGSDLVSVDQNGLVSGKNAGTGSATVQVKTTDGGFTATCAITITSAETRKSASILTFTSASGALTPSDITYIGEKGFASNATAVNSSKLRVYQNGGLVTIAAAKGCTIDEVVITTSSSYASTTVATFTERQTTRPTTGVTVKKLTEISLGVGMNTDTAYIYCANSSSDSRLEIASMVVYYTGTPATLSSLSLSGEYQMHFERNDAFNHDGAIVTANFEGGATADVTKSAVFSTPDMTTTGEKTITVSYGDKETSYKIEVTAPALDTLKLTGAYQTIFYAGNTFNHDNLVATAGYSNNTEQVVTESVVISEPDMSTTGEKVITVSYTEGTATISAYYSIKVLSNATIFFESFDKTLGTGGNDGQWNGSIASNTIVADNDDWSFTKEGGAYKCAKFGNSSNAGKAITPSISANGDTAFVLTFKAAGWDGTSENLTLNISTSNGVLSKTSIEMAKAAWTDYAISLTGVTSNFQITFEASQATNNRFFLDEIMVRKAYVRSGLTVGRYGTLCLPYAVAKKDMVGFEAYKIVSTDATAKNLIVESVESLEAGHAYIINPTDTIITCMYTGEPANAPVLEKGLTGTFVGTSFIGNGSQYVVANNKIYTAGNVTIGANKGWIEMGSVPTYEQAHPAQAGARRIVLGIEGSNTATGLDDAYIIDMNNTQKIVFHGQLYIIRDGHMFNAQGQLVK